MSLLLQLHHQLSKRLPSRRGRGSLSWYPVPWTWTTFQVVEVPRSKSLVRLLFLRFPSLHLRQWTWTTLWRMWSPSKQFISSRLIFLPLQPKPLVSLLRQSPLIVLPIWFWTRVTHGGRSKESSLIVRWTSAITCQWRSLNVPASTTFLR